MNDREVALNRCELDAAIGVHSECAGGECPYWRAVDHLGVRPQAEGCAIQYFELLGGSGSEIAEWLQSVRDRLVDEAAGAAPAKSA